MTRACARLACIGLLLPLGCRAADGAIPREDIGIAAPLVVPERDLVVGSASVAVEAPTDAQASFCAEPSRTDAVAPENVIAPARSTVAFVGDIAFAFDVASIVAKDPAAVARGFPFDAVADRLRGYPLLVGNLECVVAKTGPPEKVGPLVAPLSAPGLLLRAGFDVVSVANNHTLDKGRMGYLEMLEHLRVAGLPYTGDHQTHVLNDAFIVREVEGVKVAIIGHYNRAERLALRDIARARAAADVVIVFVHWGNDFDLQPTRAQRRAGRVLIDAGADAVVGAHPHVVQAEEMHRGKLIAYSIGNFVFSGMDRAGTKTGVLLELDVERGRGVVDHRYVRVRIDKRGAPSFQGEPLALPPLDDPPLERGWPTLPEDWAPSVPH
jgi:poly-gamma-glutamate synthesis protein (capsule biosynthesis protein)